MVCGCHNHLHLLYIRILFCYRPQHGVDTQGQSLWLLGIRPLQLYSRIKDLRFKGGCHNEVPQTGCLNRNLLSHSLEARSLIQRGSRMGSIWRLWRKDLFHPSLLASGNLWYFLLVARWLQSSHGFFPVSKFPSRTQSYRIRGPSCPVWLTLTNYLCNYPVYK